MIESRPIELQDADERLFELISPEAEIATVVDHATGLIEGATWIPRLKALAFNEVAGSTTYLWTPAADRVEVLRRNNGLANGMALDDQGRLNVCEHHDSRVVRREADGRTVVLASHYLGQELNSPNDVIVSAAGRIYFTDPKFGREPYFGREREAELDFCGVLMVGEDAEHPILLADDFEGPNGLCLSPDGATLYVNDTLKMQIRRFAVDAEGRLSGGEVFAQLPGQPEIAKGIPDGMKCDALGNVYCTGPGGIWVFNADGERLGVLSIPGHAVNFCFGEADRSSLLIGASNGGLEPFTDRGNVYRVDLLVAGAPIPHAGSLQESGRGVL
jgi:gluconolactonase